MRLGLIGESLLERIIARTNVAPAPLIETQIAFTMARSIMAGVKLGIYEAVGTSARTAPQVAEVCKTDPEATTKLMNALVGCGYLRHRAGRYSLAPKARKWLLRDSPTSLADKLLFQYEEWDVVAQYERYITTGEPLDVHGSSAAGWDWNGYQRAMRALASISAAEVATRLPMPTGATTMLDVGGSHGYYSVCTCRRYADLRVTILDLPEAVECAAPILAREGMGERIRYRAGNALSEELGVDAWDVIFLSQLVHHFTDEQNRGLMRRIARALKTNGVCVLLDTLRPSSPEEAGGMGAVLDLYFAATSRSGTWPLTTMQAWQRDAGLRVEKPIHLRTLPGAAMLVAGKPSVRAT